MAYNQTDIDVRLQLIGCKYAELASNYAKDLKYGRKCAKKNKEILIILEAYMEIIECYTTCVNTTLTLSTATVQIDTIGIGSEVILSITLPCDGGSVVLANITSATTNPAVFMAALVVAINNSTPVSHITATFVDGDPGSITLSGECVPGCIDGRSTSIEIDGIGSSTITGFSAVECTCVAVDDDYNCVTEEELDTIFDNISKLTELCFRPKGFEYTPA